MDNRKLRQEVYGVIESDFWQDLTKRMEVMRDLALNQFETNRKLLSGNPYDFAYYQGVCEIARMVIRAPEYYTALLESEETNLDVNNSFV